MNKDMAEYVKIKETLNKIYPTLYKYRQNIEKQQKPHIE